ncbi:Transcriptional regulator GlxA family, contains an amidase domain and an AraC-type DNA-binding HTH domain [Streptacidiphilus jiangxiensis]|uniref:Transcriptional regulator GlxA family, contains an amidase domain and an AraC-type DNA-binding HTH domain n=1 Tax=Streptacidiphilus jiangxiensis TaxID=235985 RepID=A0A1H7RW24_STRJI|nr:Transcriptional regulator GlxA family, contains an amidase domain and an AraC-type DNA-binding HTH domain [Streptacidiphilus jiangxiensis]
MSRVSRNTATGDEAAAGVPIGATGSGSLASGSTGLATASRKLSGRRRPEIVAVLLFSGGPIFESSIPLSVFGIDRQDTGLPHYRLLVCAGENGPLATTGGLTMTAPYGLDGLARAGTVVVPAWRSAGQTPPAEALAALRKAHAEGARIIGLCTGAFVLAAAGLLDGRPATTHWMYAPTLAKRYPQIQVDPRELFIDEGDVLTSAGTAAGIDLCLHVVRTDHGAEAAATLARRLVVPVRRSGGQAPYVDRSLPEEIGNDPLAEVVTWALDNLSKQFDVEVLAARAYMSRRTFDRRFRSLTGSAPLQWLISQRVLQAQRLLETTELSVDEVARRCGFRSPVALRGHFRRQLGVSPAVYRSTFRAKRPEPGGPGGGAVGGNTGSGLGSAVGTGSAVPTQGTTGSGGGEAFGSSLPTVPPQGSPGRGRPTPRVGSRSRQPGPSRPASADHSSPTEDGRPGPAQALSHPESAPTPLRRRGAERR